MLVILMIQFNYCENQWNMNGKTGVLVPMKTRVVHTLERFCEDMTHTHENIAAELVWERQAGRTGQRA